MSDDTVFKMKRGKEVYYQPGDYIRPLGYIEKYVEIMSRTNNFNTVVGAWIKAKTEIKPEMVKEALGILIRRYATFQFCLGEKRFQPWFRRMKKTTVELEVMTENDMDVYQRLLYTVYDLKRGPLWKAALVYYTADSQCGGKGEFSAALLLSAHHLITDGTTSLIFLREVVKIINSLSKGNSVTQETVPMWPLLDNTISVLPQLGFLSKYVCSKIFSVFVLRRSQFFTFDGALPKGGTKFQQAKVIFNTIPKHVNSELLQKCKAKNVSMNSCMTTLINYALLHVAQQRSKSDLGSRKIACTHAINLRTYYDKQYDEAMGSLSGAFECTTSHSLSEEFWSSVPKLHKTITTILEKKIPLKIIPIIPMQSSVSFINEYLPISVLDSHYTSSNMGNLRKIMPDPKENEDFEIVYVMRSTRVEYSGKSFFVYYQTFRGELLISIDYSTNDISEEVITDILYNICLFIEKVSRDEPLK